MNRGEDVNQRDNQLRTALFIAAMRRLPNMVAMLLDFGAVVDMRIQGKTALRGAVLQLSDGRYNDFWQRGHRECIDRLMLKMSSNAE